MTEETATRLLEKLGVIETIIELKVVGGIADGVLEIRVDYAWFDLPLEKRHNIINKTSQLWRNSGLLESRTIRLITPTGSNGGGKRIGRFANGRVRYEVCDMQGNDQSEILLPRFGQNNLNNEVERF